MDKATMVPFARQPALSRYVKEHVLHHAVTEEELVQVIENLNWSYTKGSGASMAVRELFHAGTLELRAVFLSLEGTSRQPLEAGSEAW